MAFKIQILPRATKEISDAIDWYESRRKGLGEDFWTELKVELLRIQENPLIFPFYGGERKQVRKAVVKRFPYLILFRIYKDKVFVLSVFHTHLDPNKKPSV